MKKLFLASSFSDVIKFLPDFIKEKYKGETVTFIPTASLVEEVDFYVYEAQKSFKNIGFKVKTLDLLKDSEENIFSEITANEYIYISGGNTFYLLQELQRSGADKIIKDAINNGKIYIGESAGAMILSPDIEYVSLMDDKTKAESLNNFKSLGIIDFYPLPHLGNFPFIESVENIIKTYGAKIDLRPFNNNQVITVSADKLDILG